MPTNKSRAADARAAMGLSTSPRQMQLDPASAVVDLLANLMHFCHQRKKPKIDFADCLRIASDHFETETHVKSGVPEAPEELTFTLNELGNTYASVNHRFIVSFIAGYGPDDEVNTYEEAVAAAIRLTNDEGSYSTHWYVYDRKTKQLQMIEQGQADGSRELLDEVNKGGFGQDEETPHDTPQAR